MMFNSKSLFIFILGYAAANGLAVRDSVTISLSINVDQSTFQSFEDPATLRKFVRNHGLTASLPYTKFANDVSYVINFVENGSLAPMSTTKEYEKDTLSARDDSPITTHTHSTTLTDGPSYTNVSVSAFPFFIEGLCFTDGDTGSSSGVIQRATTASSDCSSGTANSTNHVTGSKKKIRINVSAEATGANAKEVINGGQPDALMATACASPANGASANAFLNTTIYFPVNHQGQLNNGSTGNAFCQAGVGALYDYYYPPSRASMKPSSSKSVAALAGMEAVVTCAGKTFSANQGTKLQYRIQIKGKKKQGKFMGFFKVIRRAWVHASCS